MSLRLPLLLGPLLLLLGATGAEAYIGPGAGFAVLSSFLVMLLSFAMALASIVVWPIRFFIRWLRNRGRPRGAVDKVVIVGLDGLDPGLADKFMKEGKLPNLSRLAAQGSFSPLAVSYPSISPAAWSSFMTGVDCSYHNIFDFLGRDPRNYRPVLTSAEIKGPRTISVGRWRIPVGRGRVKLLRKSKPFWSLLGEHGIFSTIIRVPITFPPEKFYGVCLSGMCAPDLRGSQGTFTHYTTRQQQATEKEGGMTVRVDRRRRRHPHGALRAGGRDARRRHVPHHADGDQDQRGSPARRAHRVGSEGDAGAGRLLALGAGHVQGRARHEGARHLPVLSEPDRSGLRPLRHADPDRPGEPRAAGGLADGVLGLPVEAPRALRHARPGRGHLGAQRGRHQRGRVPRAGLVLLRGAAADADVRARQDAPRARSSACSTRPTASSTCSSAPSRTIIRPTRAARRRATAASSRTCTSAWTSSSAR